MLNHFDVEESVYNVVADLQDAGYETYIVGGAIRDLLLNRTPKDYDISTAATPEQVREVFGKRRARIIGRRFQLVHVRSGKEHEMLTRKSVIGNSYVPSYVHKTAGIIFTINKERVAALQNAAHSAVLNDYGEGWYNQ